ncbi:NAD-dependent malic enzyme [Rubripirellula sp.]|nr:NAD-dependent malic enzyme [Rubripirellula sp.]MDB4645068.1 NAD-dependent malic enzyme [Rubripirellula sp.]
MNMCKQSSQGANLLGKRGRQLIEDPLLNRGTAFSDSHRRELGLRGLLPPHVETLEMQAERAYEAYRGQASDLDKHVFLRQLQDENETLYYRLLLNHVQEMMPIVYTPIVGLACQKFSHIYRRPRGMFLSFPDRGSLDGILSNAPDEVDIIVVTDGERILGLGDQGVGGMGIPIGKLSLYSLCGGIHPRRTLPVMLDLGTDNHELLSDPQYIGWRHERIKGDQYESFIAEFVQAVKMRYPNVLLQWEDFASADAERLLKYYRNELCTFNDDIQGTAAVTTGAILAAIAATNRSFEEQRFVILGTGSAGTGITRQLLRTMVASGMDESAARSRFYLIDRGGLLHQGRADVKPIHQPFSHALSDLQNWGCDEQQHIGLEEVVRHAKPTVMIGATGQAGVFSESVVREMALHTHVPVIFPLSNPTSRAEAKPADIIAWTKGKAIVATGSPFEAVTYQGVSHVISQCNNSYVFPAIGLAVLTVKAKRVTEGMFMAAALALRDAAPAMNSPGGPLLPPLSDIRELTRQIAVAVSQAAQVDGVAEVMSAEELERRLDENTWNPRY